MSSVSSGQTTWRVQAEADEMRPALGETLTNGLWPLAACVAVAMVMHFVVGRTVGEYAARILLDAGIAIVLAVSLNFVNGLTGQFSIGHAGFMAVGGYMAAMLTYYGSLQFWGDLSTHGGWLGAGEWLFAVNCLIGGLAGAVLGFLVGLPTLRLRGDYLAIVTLGFGEIIRVFLTQTNDALYSAEDWHAALHQAAAAPLVLESWEPLFPPPVGGALGFSGVPKYTSLFWVYLFAGLTILVALRMKFSSHGRMLISIREDEIAAQAMGVHITRWKVRAFVISAFFAGVAGGLFAHENAVIISPKDAGFTRSFEIVIMVVLGGRGSISGVALAAVILTILPEALRELAEYRQIGYALMLIGMMLLRPQGLFGLHEIWDYLPQRRKIGGGRE